MLRYKLQGLYGQASLEGIDQAVVFLLQDVAAQCGIELVLAKTKTEQGECYVSYCDEDFDECGEWEADDWVGGKRESTYTAGHWVGLDGRDADLCAMEISPEDIVQVLCAILHAPTAQHALDHSL